MIARQDLLRVRTRALRHNVWFKVLSRTERAILDLTVKCVKRIRSDVLEDTVSAIVGKVLEVLESKFIFNAEKIGRKIADAIGGIAQRWGNKNASAWNDDPGFVRFLGVNVINQTQRE